MSTSSMTDVLPHVCIRRGCWWYFTRQGFPTISDKMKNKNKNTTHSEQFQNQISKSQKEAKLIHLTHKYMTAHFLAWQTHFNKKWRDEAKFYGPKPPLNSKYFKCQFTKHHIKNKNKQETTTRLSTEFVAILICFRYILCDS